MIEKSSQTVQEISDEKEIENSTLKENNSETQKEEDLLNNINILINNNLEKPFRKNICYIIIGAFSYVDKNIKKIYKNIDFI